MKFLMTVMMVLFVGSAFAKSAAELEGECKQKKWGSCFELGNSLKTAGKLNEAAKFFDISCTATHEASCHMLGLMWATDKTDAEKAQKGKAALQKACTMKYKPACEDLQKL
jgi:TPR repeat protein